MIDLQAPWINDPDYDDSYHHRKYDDDYGYEYEEDEEDEEEEDDD